MTTPQSAWKLAFRACSQCSQSVQYTTKPMLIGSINENPFSFSMASSLSAFHRARKEPISLESYNSMQYLELWDHSDRPWEPVMTFFVTFLTISVVPPALTADQSDSLLVVVIAWCPYPERLHPKPLWNIAVRGCSQCSWQLRVMGGPHFPSYKRSWYSPPPRHPLYRRLQWLQRLKASCWWGFGCSQPEKSRWFEEVSPSSTRQSSCS